MGIWSEVRLTRRSMRRWGAALVVLWSVYGVPLNAEQAPVQPESQAAEGTAGQDAAASGKDAGTDASEAGAGGAPKEAARPGFEVRRARVDSEWALINALGKEVPGAEIVPLGEPDKPAPAMYWPAVARKNEGGALMLTTVGGDIARRGLARRLAVQLPEAGWHTLTTVLRAPVKPAPKRVLPPRRDPRSATDGEAEGSGEADASAGDAAGESDATDSGQQAGQEAGTAGADNGSADKTVDIDVVGGDAPAGEAPETDAGAGAPQPEQKAAGAEESADADESPWLDNTTRMALAMDELARRGFQNNAVIAEGGEVPDVLAWLASLPDIPPKGLVLILVNAPLDSWSGWLEKQPALKQLAVLDIWDRDQVLLARQADLRLKSARRAGFRRYDPYPVSAPGLPGGQSRLARKIVHWLRTVAPGEDRAVSASDGA
ncbi:MAG: DUF3530 family protein [Gammaproteobacteria bacterium]|nr:MAG: DUF3530 family protein [Gammaproteobacteria bacterium]